MHNRSTPSSNPIISIIPSSLKGTHISYPSNKHSNVPISQHIQSIKLPSRPYFPAGQPSTPARSDDYPPRSRTEEFSSRPSSHKQANTSARHSIHPTSHPPHLPVHPSDYLASTPYTPKRRSRSRSPRRLSRRRDSRSPSRHLDSTDHPREPPRDYRERDREIFRERDPHRAERERREYYEAELRASYEHESRYPEPRHVEPRHSAEPRHLEPRHSEPRNPEPRNERHYDERRSRHSSTRDEYHERPRDRSLSPTSHRRIDPRDRFDPRDRMDPRDRIEFRERPIDPRDHFEPEMSYAHFDDRRYNERPISPISRRGDRYPPEYAHPSAGAHAPPHSAARPHPSEKQSNNPSNQSPESLSRRPPEPHLSSRAHTHPSSLPRSSPERHFNQSNNQSLNRHPSTMDLSRSPPRGKAKQTIRLIPPSSSSSSPHASATHDEAPAAPKWTVASLLVPTPFHAIDAQLGLCARDKGSKALWQAKWEARQANIVACEKRRIAEAAAIDRMIAAIDSKRCSTFIAQIDELHDKFDRKSDQSMV